jgi:hypothetical protein
MWGWWLYIKLNGMRCDFTLRRGTLMTDDISHAVSSSFGSDPDRRRGFQGREAKAPARMRVDRRQQPQPTSPSVTAHDKGR